MARHEVEVEVEGPELKYLGFVRIFGLWISSLLQMLYEYVKLHAGRLRLPLSIAKDVAMIFIRPLYCMFKGVPDKILVFLHNMLDKYLNDERTPASVKWFLSQSLYFTEQTFELAQIFVHTAQVKGLNAAIAYVVAELNKIFMSQLMKMLFSANKLPFAGMFLSPVTGLLSKYNQGITSLTQKGFTALSHLPIVPVDKIGHMLKPGEGNLLNQGLSNVSNVMGGISGAINKGASALNPAPVVQDVAKVADAAASAAQNVVGNVVGNATKVVGDAGKVADAAASAAQNVVGNVVGDATKVVGNTTKVADAAASAAQNVVGNVVDDATKVADAAASAAYNVVGNVVGDATKAVGDATKVADAAASAAQNVIGNVIGTGGSALGSLPLLGGKSKNGKGAAPSVDSEVEKGSAAEEAEPVAEKGSTAVESEPVAEERSTAVGSEPAAKRGSTAVESEPVASDAVKSSNGKGSPGHGSLFGGIRKVAKATVSAVDSTVDKGASLLEPVPLAGDAAKVANFASHSTAKTVNNVMDKFRLP